MSIEDAFSKAKLGQFPSDPVTPVSDKAREVFLSDMAFRQKWDLILALEKELDQSNKDDCYRYGSIIEGMHADAETAEDIAYMNLEEGWQA